MVDTETEKEPAELKAQHKFIYPSRGAVRSSASSAGNSAAALKPLLGGNSDVDARISGTDAHVLQALGTRTQMSSRHFQRGRRCPAGISDADTDVLQV